ncbi:DUF1877 family protein [Streptomyces sp. NPDC007251]|uniref:DUF1877 family protein n=1 Tax=unclassified Streptomyces TaxID=2593676 RepID=UPI003409835A
MSAHLRLRAVPPPALRNSATWLERQFEEGGEGVRHREEALDERYLDQERLYAGAHPQRAENRPRTQVVLGGRPVFRRDRHRPRLLVLTSAQARRVAGFLSAADFETLWDAVREDLLPRYGGAPAEPETWAAFAVAHQELRAFYAQTAACGDAVVKRLPADARPTG